MRRGIIGFIVSGFFFILIGCMDQMTDSREMLSQAIQATMQQEESVYRGYAELSVADQVIYREEAALSDGRDIINSFQEFGTSPVASALFVPLAELEAAAGDVQLKRRNNQIIELAIDIDPDAAKKGIEQYLGARLSEIRNQFDGQHLQDEERLQQMNEIIQQEQAMLDSMLNTLTCTTRYTMTMDSTSYVIHKLDATSTLRYMMEGRTRQETVSGRFHMTNQE